MSLLARDGQGDGDVGVSGVAFEAVLDIEFAEIPQRGGNRDLAAENSARRDPKRRRHVGVGIAFDTAVQNQSLSHSPLRSR